ncbi:DNA helicase [Nonlabens sp. YIK11]|uniref:replicative DNA helicase n=1 Tax=Nonlabens sp. YIK11 TaxID=1453349 RepID=UPI0006DD251A|nr:replicative DNA helicase [Nonlabens sp. YIK11]KQC33006.1 DNA helicase [Nonlabens sp. YIK11]
MEKVQERVSIVTGNSPVISLEKGKIPPQAIDLEKVVLGALMIDGKGVDEVIDLLTPDAFYHKAHQSIFDAIDKLFKSGSPVDLLTVSAQLRRDEKLESVGGDHYLVQLSQLVSSTAHIEFHARIILQKFIQRSLIKISTEIINDSYEESTDVFDLLDKAESKLYEVAQGNIRKSTETAMDLVRQAKQRIEEIAKRDGLSGVPTGFNDLDKLTSGWQPSDLVIIAARPGMGKTAFTLSMARNIAVGSNIPVAFFSLEMSSVQLITRLISSETGLSSEKLRTGNLEPHEWEQLNVKVKDLEQAPIFIDDTPSLSIFDLRAKCRRLASQHGIKLIMVDYLQLMTAQTNAKGGNREQEISTISRNLKALAKELEVPVIALSQLSRAVETRGGSKRPLLSDLRESGAIEQDADIVSFIYRPEYYGLEEWDDDDQTPCKNQAEFIVAKHRNGATDSIRLKFLGQFGKFDNLEEQWAIPQEFGSKMNQANDDTFRPDTPKFPSPGDAFGGPQSDDDDGLAF